MLGQFGVNFFEIADYVCEKGKKGKKEKEARRARFFFVFFLVISQYLSVSLLLNRIALPER